nr:SsrA-binding protein SmpB [Peptoniphilus raoultii]
MKMKKKTEWNNLSTNKSAGRLYFIEDTYEAGLVLAGTEVKSIRRGGANLKDAYCEISSGEIFISNMHISPYEEGNIYNLDPKRKRKLLMHKSEIRRLEKVKTLQGYTIIPLRLYLVRGRVKAEIATARGKKLYDKREDMAKKDAERRMKRSLDY